jgi:hypothetical protein
MADEAFQSFYRSAVLVRLLRPSIVPDPASRGTPLVTAQRWVLACESTERDGPSSRALESKYWRLVFGGRSNIYSYSCIH